MNEKSVDCTKCEHFYITWDVKFPKGCRLFGFKSSQPPSFGVKDATGKQCEHFKPRSQKK